MTDAKKTEIFGNNVWMPSVPYRYHHHQYSIGILGKRTQSRDNIEADKN